MVSVAIIASVAKDVTWIYPAPEAIFRDFVPLHTLSEAASERAGATPKDAWALQIQLEVGLSTCLGDQRNVSVRKFPDHAIMAGRADF